MNWATKRKLTYGISFVLIILAVTIYLLRDIVFPAPTCFDKKQNGFESGVDCGGNCELFCKNESYPLSVKWSGAFKVEDKTYDLSAMISNKNIDNAPKKISYKFSVYGKNGNLIGTSDGESIVPIDGEFPILNQNISIEEEPKSVTVSISQGDNYKVKEKGINPTLTVKNINYEAGNPTRVYVTVKNNKLVVLRNLPVVAVMYDANDNAYAVGKSVITQLSKEEQKDIVFVWNTAFKENPVKVRVYPIFDPFIDTGN